MLIDTHFHLDLMDNMQYLIHEFGKANIGIIAVGTTPKAFIKEKRFCLGVDNIKVGLGFHPQLVSEREQEIDLFLNVISECRYIGEIGLDFDSPYIGSRERQLTCFRKIIKACAHEGGKILSLHSVRATGAVLNELEEAGVSKSCACILHWFTGTTTERKRAIETGAYFSINHRMLRTKLGQETIRSIPADRILLETDAPFTKKIEGMSDLESRLINTVDGISKLRDESMLSQIEKNSERIWL